MPFCCHYPPLRAKLPPVEAPTNTAPGRRTKDAPPTPLLCSPPRGTTRKAMLRPRGCWTALRWPRPLCFSLRLFPARHMGFVTVLCTLHCLLASVRAALFNSFPYFAIASATYSLRAATLFSSCCIDVVLSEASTQSRQRIIMFLFIRR